MEERIKEKLEIVSSATKPAAPICGVYFLLRGEDIIYIGQSRNVQQRLASHHKIGYTSFYVHTCHDAYLDSLEAEYILKFKPEFNSNVPNNEKWKTAIQIKEYANADSVLDIRKYLEKLKIPFKVFRGVVYYDFFETFDHMAGKK